MPPSSSACPADSLVWQLSAVQCSSAAQQLSLISLSCSQQPLFRRRLDPLTRVVQKAPTLSSPPDPHPTADPLGTLLQAMDEAHAPSEGGMGSRPGTQLAACLKAK